MSVLPNKYSLFLFLFFCFISDSSVAQSQEKELIKVDEVIVDLANKQSRKSDSLQIAADDTSLTRKEKKAQRIKQGKVVFTAYIAPAYSPELEFAISGGALVTFSTKSSDTVLLRSSVPVAFTISSNGSKLFTSYWTTFFKQNKILLNGIIQYRDLADHYYGVGYEKGLSTQFPDSTSYRRKFWQIYGKPMWKINRTMYVGFIGDFNYTQAIEVNDFMLADEDFIRDGPENYNTGVGLAVSYDTRDFPQNAYSGALLSVSVSNYGRSFGGKNTYQVFDIEYRKYFSLSTQKAGRILAIDFHARHTFNDVPYGELSYSGSPFDIRGYRILRFRDRVANNLVVEYRHKFHGNSFMAKKSGFVLWAGLGSIGPETGKSFFVNTLPNVGIGYRFEAEHRLNVRIDFGIGKESNGLYFNFQEAY